jgi:signal transduction histidine kinase
MFRRSRHKILLLLQTGIIASAAIALSIQPSAWLAILVATAGASATGWYCGRLVRRRLHATLGHLRRVAEDVSRGRMVELPATRPGDDAYKLTNAMHQLTTRLGEAIREEHRLQDELRRRERLAFLGELAASVAHEVNNPLDGVQNCARILRRSLDDPARRENMLDLIDGGLERIELIVRRLLTLAREHVVRPLPVSLAELLQGAVQIMQRKLDDGQVRCTLHCNTDDDVASADRPLLEGVFVNLVQNAIDSMPTGGEITISIARRNGRENGETLAVEIADSGAGIPPDVLPHIFEPFFTTKTGGKGTGLGLALAARIVDAHGGAIDVAPGPAGGTVFTVRLPVLPSRTGDGYVPISATKGSMSKKSTSQS